MSRPGIEIDHTGKPIAYWIEGQDGKLVRYPYDGVLPLKDFKSAIIALREAFKSVTKSIGATMRVLRPALIRMAEREYHRVHGRLPGSPKTKRLRKKREKMIMDWYARQTQIKNEARRDFPGPPGG